MKQGSLMIVGTGIELGAHLTLSAQAWIREADKVLYAVADPLTAEWLRTMNATAEALPYRNAARRKDTYRQMVELILGEVRQGKIVCAVFYGHPGVFADAPHEALRRARQEGYLARMLPGISAEDCLFADLGVDPGQQGCQSFEATDFLIRSRKFDPHSSLVLWQISMIGNTGFYTEGGHLRGLQILQEVLAEHYPSTHEVVIYEAAIYPTHTPRIERLPLSALANGPISDVATLYVPPLATAPLDEAMMARLGMPVPAHAKRQDDCS